MSTSMVTFSSLFSLPILTRLSSLFHSRLPLQPLLILALFLSLFHHCCHYCSSLLLTLIHLSLFHRWCRRCRQCRHCSFLLSLFPFDPADSLSFIFEIFGFVLMARRMEFNFGVFWFEKSMGRYLKGEFLFVCL